MKKIVNLICLNMLASCAIGPLTSHETARTVGDKKHQIVGGYGNSGNALKWNYGITENFDLGLHLESFSAGIRGKYSFINNQDHGFSLAAALGTGKSIGGNHFYGDIMGSYLAGKWEPYSHLRFVRVKVDEMDFNDKETGQTNFKVDASQFTYGQYILGTRYIFNERWFLSIEGSALFTISSIKMSDSFIYSGALGYRF